MRLDEPEVEFVLPWVKVILISLGAYIFALLTTILPARQAASIAPAEALRYEQFRQLLKYSDFRLGNSPHSAGIAPVSSLFLMSFSLGAPPLRERTPAVL